MYYLIKKTLEECSAEDICKGDAQYVAVLTKAEWAGERERFEFGIDLDLDPAEIHNTKIEVNYDSLTGTFAIPDRSDLAGEDSGFAFALDEKGVVFIDDSGTAERIIGEIRRSKLWRLPCLERFIYDFLEQIIHGDLRLMEGYEDRLDAMEKAVLKSADGGYLTAINAIRGDLRQLRVHYEQLIDLSQELEEDENDFFKEENLRYFHMFSNRMARLIDVATSLRDYTMQLSDMYQSQIDLKQNRIMTVLTVVTAIFMPLTLIVGWYGMNFRFMPELDKPWGYPAVIALSVVVAVVCIIFFKKKKWL
ncbi:MAG: magnesium transporter CorA [Oscillospiraceae bacterium]|nr:magnesium transporter CorA [Oscillospiraceae bacterium]